MLIRHDDGTFTAGPLDAIQVLHDVNTGRYHACFFEEHPLPGPVLNTKDTKVVRLKSKMHHTQGAETLEGARQCVTEMRKQIILDDSCVFPDVFEWDGELGIVQVLPNWRLSH